MDMRSEEESRKEMKSRLYSLLAEKQEKDGSGSNSIFPFWERSYSFAVNLKGQADFDEVSRSLEEAAKLSGMEYARLGFVAYNAGFAVVYFKKSEKRGYIETLFNPFAYSIINNTFMMTEAYTEGSKLSNIYINCKNPRAHKKEFVDFFLNLYRVLYNDGTVPIEEYIK